jgi:hypothetical protein
MTGDDHPTPSRDRAEGEEVSEPQNWPNARTIVLTILAMIAAAALTIEGTYLILNAFVLHDPSDPLTKSGGLSPEKNARGK